MIEVKNLTKYYGDFLAVNDLSFQVPEGCILGFLGPNGAGKTTTMRVLTGFMPASSGELFVGGHDVFTHPMEIKKRIGYLPELPPLYPDMRVESYLHFVAKIKGVGRADRKAGVEKVIEFCALEEKRSSLIRSLSKGYRQRVGLAQAMVHDPPILILDEPTIGLDPRQIIDIRSLIKNLGKNRTVILSTHILPEVTMTCDRVLIIHRGKKVVDDEVENVTRTMNIEEAFLKLVEEAEGEEIAARLAASGGEDHTGADAE